jgi:hypothetical protein
MIAPYGVSGQAAPAEGPSNIECLERLEMPEYPQIPSQAGIEGVQTVRLLLSEQAIVQTIESTIQTKFPAFKDAFRESAEKALKNSHFSKSCGGKTITLFLHYELRHDKSESLFAFRPPNHFWIRAGPNYIQPSSVK